MSKKVYTEEFKQSAVEMVVVQRHTMSSVAKRLGVNYHMRLTSSTRSTHSCVCDWCGYWPVRAAAVFYPW